MKVKELIAELQKLDPENGIWVCCDLYYFYPPIPERAADKFDEESHQDKGIKEGDYVIPIDYP